MANKVSRRKRRLSRINLTPREGRWITYQLLNAGIYHKDVAPVAGTSPSLVSQFLRGTKNSERVKAALISVLHYDSWEELVFKARRAS